MIPKKIYLNYVNEDDDEKTWSEEPVSVNDCDMQNREYTDLSQVWHHHSVVPTERNKNIIYITTFDEIYIERIPRCLGGKLTDNSWNDFAMRECVIGWAYIDDLMPKNNKIDGSY